MSVTIRSEIVDLDSLIPRVVDAEREDADVAALLPWVFWNQNFASAFCTKEWPQKEWRFRNFFYKLECFAYEIGSHEGIEAVLKSNENISLPKKSWKMITEESGRSDRRSQAIILLLLVETIYRNLEGSCERFPRIYFQSPTVQKYVIGGKLFASKTAGAMTLKLKNKYIPIISFTAWYDGQTWDQILIETLSIMLGHLARNMPRRGVALQDEEVYTVGLHGSHLHIAYGLFLASTVKRVHPKGCSPEETFDLKFSRSYNLSLKEDWLEATRALSRLVRYLLSGEAKVGVVQDNLRAENGTASQPA